MSVEGGGAKKKDSICCTILRVRRSGGLNSGWSFGARAGHRVACTITVGYDYLGCSRLLFGLILAKRFIVRPLYSSRTPQ